VKGNNGLPHGSIIYYNDLILQVLGLPSPPGLLPVMPKYRACRARSPWRRPSGPYCRIAREYGPGGLEDTLTLSGLQERYDPLYKSPMPYIPLMQVQAAITPGEAMREFTMRLSAAPKNVERAAEYIYHVIGTRGLGLTGSLAAGIPHARSDIDLVALDNRTAQRLYEVFASLSQGPRRDSFSGVTVWPPVDLSWRRTRIYGVRITWIGAGEKCRALRSYYDVDPPVRRWEGVLRVEPGQDSALAYPPCVRAGDYWLVSYEYNLGGVLYEGGKIRVSGVAGDKVVYVGVRESPARLEVLERGTL